MAVDQLTYWRNRLRGARQTEIPLDYPRPPTPSGIGSLSRIAFDDECNDLIEAVSAATESTRFAILHAAFQLLLWDQNDCSGSEIVLGTAMANRDDMGAETLIGMLVNMVVIRTSIHEAMTFSDLIRDTSSALADAARYQGVPFPMVVAGLPRRRDPSRNPLFQIAFSAHDAHPSDLKIGGARATVNYLHNGTSKFDLNAVAIMSPGRKGNVEAVQFEYDTSLFSRATIDSLANRYVQLLKGASSDPGALLGTLLTRLGA